MSTIAQQVADEHVLTSSSETRDGVIKYSAACSCGQSLPWAVRETAHQMHLFAEIERAVREQVLREFADVAQEIADLGAHNTGLRTPQHLADYARNYAARIAGGDSR